MTDVLINIDVDDLAGATAFYTRALGLQVGRRLGDDFVELVGASSRIYLILARAGTRPHPDSPTSAASTRSYQRHWTPVHLDFVVTDMQAAIDRALRAGAKLEGPARQEPYGLLALLSDPFGHGFCLLQFQGSGYDAIAT